MNGSQKLVLDFIDEFQSGNVKSQNVNAIFCPPFPFIDLCNYALSKYASIGGQNCSHLPPGSATGEVSASMLSEMNCKYVIIGHSERRGLFRETEDLISKKVHIAMENGLCPIVCVGELKEENKFDVIKRTCSSLPKNIIIAYEPIWSIGTGLIPNPIDVQETISYIRSIVPESTVVYGGSVGLSNALDFIKIGTADGLLIGKASLDPKEFISILNLLDQFSRKK